MNFIDEGRGANGEWNGGGTDGASATHFEAAEAGKGRGADGDVRREFADHHHLGGFGGDEFGGHDER